ncbi:hypothetical protein [Acidovorax phage AP1]|nr:hypothetical protein [Acidovorax phage AP1]
MTSPVSMALAAVAVIAVLAHTYLEGRGVAAADLLIVALVATLASCAAK